jgi:hypothetical protein
MGQIVSNIELYVYRVSQRMWPFKLYYFFDHFGGKLSYGQWQKVMYTQCQQEIKVRMSKYLVHSIYFTENFKYIFHSYTKGKVIAWCPCLVFWPNTQANIYHIRNDFECKYHLMHIIRERQKLDEQLEALFLLKMDF